MDCLCGCGRSLEKKRAGARFFEDSCRKRYGRQALENPDETPPKSDTPVRDTDKSDNNPDTRDHSRRAFIRYLDQRISELHRSGRFPGRLARTEAQREFYA